jgi:hypothetical protein
MLALLVSACSEERHKLDEVAFLNTPQLTLKLVRYDEVLLFSYDGEIYVTQCGSSNSKGLPPSDVSEAGWRVIDHESAIGSKSASSVLVACAAADRDDNSRSTTGALQTR